jgi:mannose-6-phosphate isomerase-like protein (cupin superfamily)
VTGRGYAGGMSFVDSRDLRPVQPLAGWSGRFFHSDNMTFVYYDVDADAVPIHEHHHPEEEVWHVLEGELAITLEGVEHRAGPGCAAIVPSNVRHAARPLGAARAIVVDHPVRYSVGGIPVRS